MSASLAFWLAAEAQRTFGALRLETEELERLARRRLRRLLAAAAHTPFYGERLAAASVDLADPTIRRDPAAALAALPLVSKRELREAGARALDGGRAGAGWYSSRSSGSTGEPFQVYYHPRAWAVLKYLVKLRARLECGMRLSDRVASLEPISGGERASASAAVSRQRFARFNLLRPTEEIANALVRFAPDMLTGLPSALLETGRVLEASGRQVAVRGVFTGGELLQRASRGALERVYGAPVFDVYGTSETKEIAWECRLGGLHLNSDVVHVEVVDETGLPVPIGREGEIVATVLVSHAMPLVRYRTGDWGSLQAGRCPCGRALPLLGIVTGREAETLLFAGGRRVSPYALTCSLEQVSGLVRYQVVQVGAARLLVRAITSGAVERPSVAQGIRTALLESVAPSLEIDVDFVESLPSGPRSKARVVQRLEVL